MISGWNRAQVAANASHDIPEGWYVNLGVGQPTAVADAISPQKEVIFQSENGLLGVGAKQRSEPIDPWIINAGKVPVTLVPGASICDHAASFAMIRGGHLDLCILGAFEVSECGDLANWSVSSEDELPAIGGAMDLAIGARRVWVLMDHTSRQGEPRLVKQCSLPLTAPKAVSRIYTNLGIFDVADNGLIVRSLAPGVSFEDVHKVTSARLQVR